MLDAAELEFAAKYFDGVRLATIAQAVGVQQALIHHHFGDKVGLYRAVIDRVLSSMSDESLGILAALAQQAGRGRKLGAKEIGTIVGAFVEVLLRFYARHGAIASILRYEAQTGGELVRDVFVAKVKPLFDAVVGRMEEMRARGEVRADMDARHVAISAVAMVSAPFQEEPLLAMIWDVDVRSAEFLEARKREVTATILGRILP